MLGNVSLKELFSVCLASAVDIKDKLIDSGVKIIQQTWPTLFFGVFLVRISHIWTEYVERYWVSLRIQSKCGKKRTREIPNTGTFHAVSVAVEHRWYFVACNVIYLSLMCQTSLLLTTLGFCWKLNRKEC